MDFPVLDYVLLIKENVIKIGIALHCKKVLIDEPWNHKESLYRCNFFSILIN